MQRRGVWAVLATGLIAFVLIGVTSAGAAGDRKPDLGMARLGDLRIEKVAGTRLLRFSTTIVNVGPGPFEVRAARTSTTGSWTVAQRIADDVGGARDVQTSTEVVFGGDGHSHWHLRNLENIELLRLDNGSKVGIGVKFGYCFWDNAAYRLTLPGAPSTPVFQSPGCGNSTSLSLRMGLSTGWGDVYPSTLPDQYVDVTNLTSGRYRLQVTADGLGQFSESNEANNTTWVDLQLRSQGALKIVGYGPTA